ncbi:hypothetical protein PDESU_04229 [Pontiella desulfatans]|uniref:Uncharacterized protein n=1 Tax=Pontiella desulfatans TaxID=2750659 RepID=A0A6C2U897_PONDE|nr:hypothetical protein [Pontiella desulfatans]VGO15644.1 hypothetical protein PDESU_04229 [Pontiella desulfatans]
MILRRRFTGLVIALVVCVAAASLASRKNEVTLLLVPREDRAKRIGMDIAGSQRLLLMSYAVGVDGSVSLHGWTGTEWVNVTVKKFREGAFFRTGPDSALIVEKAGVPVPDSLVPPEAWCGAVYKITTTEERPLIHLAGQYFDFKYKEWQAFAENYNLPLEAINPEGLNVSWYHKRLNEHFKKGIMVGSNDLRYWVAVRHPEAAVAEEPVAVPAEEAEETPAMELPDDPDTNPLTNAAPEAVVLGADTAQEAVVEEEPETVPANN